MWFSKDEEIAINKKKQMSRAIFEREESQCISDIQDAYFIYLRALFVSSGPESMTKERKDEFRETWGSTFTFIEETLQKMFREYARDHGNIPISEISRLDFTREQRQELCEKIRRINIKVLITRQLEAEEIYDVENVRRTDEAHDVDETFRWWKHAKFPCLSDDQRRQFNTMMRDQESKFEEMLTLVPFGIESEDELPGLQGEFAEDMGEFEAELAGMIEDFRIEHGISEDDWVVCTI